MTARAIARAAAAVDALEATERVLTAEKIKSDSLRSKVARLEAAGAKVVTRTEIKTRTVEVEVPCPNEPSQPAASPSQPTRRGPPASSTPSRPSSVAVTLGPAKWEWAEVADTFGTKYITVSDLEVFMEPPGTWQILPVEVAAYEVAPLVRQERPRTTISLGMSWLVGGEGNGLEAAVGLHPARWAFSGRWAESRLGIRLAYGRAPSACGVASVPIYENVTRQAELCGVGNYLSVGAVWQVGLGRR